MLDCWTGDPETRFRYQAVRDQVFVQLSYVYDDS